MPLAPGTILNQRYRVDGLLARGGFGTIYTAYDQSLGLRCALKENLEVSAQAQRQFEQEAVMLANLQHPNLPRVTDHFVIPVQGQYLVMDFIEGEDLQDLLEHRQKIAETQAIAWIGQVAGALSYLHAQQPPIIHRDVKPANIKITPGGKAMLVDFGIAKLYDPARRTTVAARGVTPGYSPVEQYGQGTTDGRSDEYALAATLYTLLVGQEPPESIDRITGIELANPRSLNPTITPAVENATLRGMALLAKDRYPTIAEFLQALQPPSPQAAASSQTVSPASPPAANNQVPQSPPSNPPSAAASPVAPAELPKVIRINLGAAPRLDEIDWVIIPAGNFLSGKKRTSLHLPDFRIARFPVTNALYRTYLQANPSVKSPGGWRGRNYPRNSEYLPVTNIRFDDAQAYCRWARCRLPSDEEWEKAARGGDGRIFPWGDQWQDGLYCNSKEAGMGSLTPVDHYPMGVSSYGIWDMAGNAWEWTANQVLRGGSWYYAAMFVQVIHRNWLRPTLRLGDVGFRPAW